LGPAFCQDPVPAGKVPTRGSIQWWQGEWTGEGACPAEKYSILLTPEKDSVRFEMKAYSGAHTGGIEGLARWETNRLVFTSMNEDSDPPAPVRVTFHQAGEKIRVFTTNTESYGGMGISFDRRIFHRGPAPEQDFSLSRGPRPLLTEEEEIKLRQMTTLDYPLFVANLHLASATTVDTPEFRGKQIDGFVRGMANTCAAIILVDRKGRMAAAVTDPESDEIRLYRDWPGDSIPAAMQLWRSNNLHPVFQWVRK